MKVKISNISESEFDKRFSISYRDNGEEFQYETYGEDFITFCELHSLNPLNCWTCIEGDNGNLFFVNGFHVVNRVYYFFTKENFEQNEQITVKLDTVEDEFEEKIEEEI